MRFAKEIRIKIHKLMSLSVCHTYQVPLPSVRLLGWHSLRLAEDSQGSPRDFYTKTEHRIIICDKRNSIVPPNHKK